MKASELLKMAGFPDTAEGRKAFYKKYPTEDSFHKKMKEGGIAFPQQATEERFFERGYVPNYPVGYYASGGATNMIAFPQMPPADMFFSGFPFQPDYAYGGAPCMNCGGYMDVGGNSEPMQPAAAPAAPPLSSQDYISQYSDMLERKLELSKMINDEQARVDAVRKKVIPSAKSLDAADDKIVNNPEGEAYQHFIKMINAKDPQELQKLIKSAPKDLKNVLPGGGNYSIAQWEKDKKEWNPASDPSRELFCTPYGCFTYQKAGAKDVPIVSGNIGFVSGVKEGTLPFQQVSASEAEPGDITLISGMAPADYRTNATRVYRPHHTTVLAEKPTLNAKGKASKVHVYNAQNGQRLNYGLSDFSTPGTSPTDESYQFYRYTGSLPKYQSELKNVNDYLSQNEAPSLPMLPAMIPTQPVQYPDTLGQIYGGQYDGVTTNYADGGNTPFGYTQFQAMKNGGAFVKQTARAMKKMYAAGGNAPQGSTMEQNYMAGPNALKKYISSNVMSNLINEESQNFMPGRFDYGGEDTINPQNMNALSNAAYGSKMHEYQNEMDSQRFSDAMANYVNDQYGSQSMPKADLGLGLTANQAAQQARINSIFGPMPTALTQKSNVPIFPAAGYSQPAAPQSMLSPELQAMADKIHADIKAVDLNPYGNAYTNPYGYRRNDPFFYKTKYKGWSNDGHSGNKFVGYSNDPFVGRNAGTPSGRMTPEQVAAAQAYWKDRGMDFTYDEKMGLLGQLFKSLGPKKVSMHLRSMPGAAGHTAGSYAGSGIHKKGWNPVSDPTGYGNPDDEINSLRKGDHTSLIEKMRQRMADRKSRKSPDAAIDQWVNEQDQYDVTAADRQRLNPAMSREQAMTLPIHQTQGQTGFNTAYPGDENYKLVQKRKLFDVGFNPGQPSAGKDALIAGINMAAGFIEGDPNKKFMESHTSAGDVFNKTSGSRGFNLFDPYAGQVANPSKMGYTNQYGNMSGNIGGYYAADGGAMPDDDIVYMDEDQIAAFLAAGGELKYVD